MLSRALKAMKCVCIIDHVWYVSVWQHQPSTKCWHQWHQVIHVIIWCRCWRTTDCIISTNFNALKMVSYVITYIEINEMCLYLCLLFDKLSYFSFNLSYISFSTTNFKTLNLVSNYMTRIEIKTCVCIFEHLWYVSVG